MKIANDSSTIRNTFESGEGVLRLIPNFLPRPFGKAGYRLRLHPDDYYAFGTARGAIKERWFSSVITALNGDDAPEDEGLSYVAADADDRVRFRFSSACEELGADLIGEELFSKYGTWPMFAKFFDYATPLFHHLHLRNEDAKKIGRFGKPEAYYFPHQLNNHLGEFPVTYFGFDPGVSKEEVRDRLRDFVKKDTRITELSRAYRIVLGTGWYTPPGVVHAPGSVLTYEPQWNSDVNSVFENVVSDEVFSKDLLVDPCPADEKDDLDYVMDLMDWNANVDPAYKAKYFRSPVDCSVKAESYTERWVAYGNPYIGAKELTIPPGATVTSTDKSAYGCVVIQGFGSLGAHDGAEAATMLRFGQPSGDEYFVSEKAAKEGVQIVNKSKWEPMVILKHFGPNNPDMP